MPAKKSLRRKDTYHFSYRENFTLITLLKGEDQGEVYIGHDLHIFLAKKVGLKEEDQFKVSSRFLPGAFSIKFNKDESSPIEEPKYQKELGRNYYDIVYEYTIGKDKYQIEFCEDFNEFFGMVRPPKNLYFKKIKPKTRKKRVSTF